MMDNPINKEELSALLDNELKGDEKRDLEENLTECKESAAEFEDLKKVSNLIKDSLEDIEVPDIWDGIKDKLPTPEELIEEDLSAYLDGELPPQAQEGVKKYLEEDEELLEKFKQLNETNQLLSEAMELPEDITVDLWDGVKDRLTTDCEVISTELSPYLDQEVVTHRHRAITKHLTDCLDCREKFEAMSSVGLAINDHYVPDIPEDLDIWTSIKPKLNVIPFKRKQKKEKPAPKPLQPRFKVMAVAAAAVIGLLGTLAVWLASPDDQQFVPIKPEVYLIESSFEETPSVAEAVIYEQ